MRLTRHHVALGCEMIITIVVLCVVVLAIVLLLASMIAIAAGLKHQ
jgi:hypothetical protein